MAKVELCRLWSSSISVVSFAAALPALYNARTHIAHSTTIPTARALRQVDYHSYCLLSKSSQHKQTRAAEQTYQTVHCGDTKSLGFRVDIGIWSVCYCAVLTTNGREAASYGTRQSSILTVPLSINLQSAAVCESPTRGFQRVCSELQRSPTPLYAQHMGSGAIYGFVWLGRIPSPC